MEDNSIVLNSIKIGLMGNSRVGKTAISNTLAGGEFSRDMITTIGADKLEKTVIVKNNEKVKVILWDTAGAERFRSAAFKWVKNADGIILVFDFCLKYSFDELDLWLNQIKENLNVSSIILFGNKADIDKNEWQVTSEEINEYVKEKRIPYFEVSAKTGEGLNEGLLYIVNEIYDKKYGDNKYKDNNVIKINESDIEKGQKKSNCVRNKKNKK